MTTTVRPLKDNDLPSLKRLFAEFPLKRFQHRFQGVNPEPLAQLFAAAEERRLKAGEPGETWQWVVERKRAPMAFAALHDDPWHSKFYAHRCARIAPFLTYAVDANERRALLEQVLEQADRQGYDHVSVRIDNAEFATARLLAEHGFYLVDASVKMSARFSAMPPDTDSGERGDIRRFDPADLKAVRRIATESHPHNHYYNDPALPRKDTNRLFEAWVERCCNGYASDVFVLDRGNGAEGFVIYLDPRAVNNVLGIRLVVLDFVCLAAGVRGQGLGRRLIRHTLELQAHRFDMVELRTSESNYPALSCYQNLAMQCVSGDFIMHRCRAGVQEA